MMLMIAPNSRARKRGEEDGGGEGGEWKNFWGGRGNCWLRGNGVTQLSTCCTMGKMDWVGIGHERFDNGGSVSGWHPGLFSLDCSWIIQGFGSILSDWKFKHFIWHIPNYSFKAMCHWINACHITYCHWSWIFAFLPTV